VSFSWVIFNQNEKQKLPENETELGKLLFSEKLLSSDKSISCASCHQEDFAFADSAQFSIGVNGKLTKRNTPSVLNVLMRESFFWDGRVNKLEDQALFPIKNPDEMNLELSEAISRLNKDDYYQKAFKKIYGKIADTFLLGKAISAFEKTLETDNSKFDRYIADLDTFTTQELRGLDIFNEKGNCFDCHFGVDFTGDEFINIGLFNNMEWKDKGVSSWNKNTSDDGKFKVPTLRNIAITAPYMHNGSFKTLLEVVEYYNNPNTFVDNPINRDSRIKDLNLTTQDKADLIAFLHTLTDKKWQKK